MEPARQPYDPKDPYWVFKEAAAFEREFSAKVEMPLLAAMAERVDQMWQDVAHNSDGIAQDESCSKQGTCGESRP
jgi:hypothetical protein